MTSKVTTLARATGIEDPGRVADDASQRPDPEVPERARRRTFTAKYSILAEAKIDHAVTGPAGAARLAPFITSIPVTDIWITETVVLADAVEAVGAEIVDEGHNILLKQAADDTPLVFHTTVEKVSTVNRFRLYFDLRQDPRRGREQADRLREEVIGF